MAPPKKQAAAVVTAIEDEAPTVRISVESPADPSEDVIEENLADTVPRAAWDEIETWAELKGRRLPS